VGAGSGETGREEWTEPLVVGEGCHDVVSVVVKKAGWVASIFTHWGSGIGDGFEAARCLCWRFGEFCCVQS